MWSQPPDEYLEWRIPGWAFGDDYYFRISLRYTSVGRDNIITPSRRRALCVCVCVCV